MTAKATPKKRRITVAAARKALEEQSLVGVNVAAQILGIQRPNFSRYRDRLEAVEIEGSGEAWFREEVEALAGTLAKERAARHGGA